MNFGKGLSVPDKAILPRSNPNTVDIPDGLLGNANWHELQSIRGGFLTDNGVVQNRNSFCPLTLEKPILPQNKPNSAEIQGAQLAEANLLEVPAISSRNPLSGLIQNKYSWEPVTPNKTLPSRSTVNPMETQVSELGKSTWVELVEMYTGLLKDPTNNHGVQSSNPSGQLGEHAEQYQGDDRHETSIVPLDYNPGRGDSPLSELSGMVHAQSVASVTGGFSESIRLAGRPTHPGFHSPIVNNCQESQTTTMHTLLYQRMSNYVSSQSHSDGFPVPFQPISNLNSLTRSEADAASETNSSQFATATSHLSNQGNHQYSVIPNFSLEKGQGKDELKNLALSTSEAIEKCLDEPLQNPVDSLSAEIATKEKGDSDNGHDQSIDLNMTPQQKTPKRRKHRPKVIIEGKPKRGRKPANNDKNAAIENPTGKRKYVRKKGLTATAAADGSILNVVSTPPSAKPKADGSNEASVPAAAAENPTRKKRKYIRKKGLGPVTQKADVYNEVSISPVGPAANSCRRMLNFDAEMVTRDESQNSVGCSHAGIYEASNNAYNLNLDPQDTISCTSINGIPGATASQLGKQNEYIKANQQAGTKSDLNCLTDPMVAYRTSLQAVSSAAPAGMKDHNLNIIATTFKMLSADPCQDSMTVSYCQMHRQFHVEKINQIAIEDVINTNSDNMGQPTLQNTQLVAENTANIDGKRGLKRDHPHASEQIHHQTENLMSSSTLSQMILQPGVPKNDKFETASSGTYKRSKNENKCHTTIYSQLPSVTAVIDCLKQAESKGKNKSCGCQLTPTSHVTLNCNAERDSTAEQISEFDGTFALWCMSPIAARHNYQNQVSIEVQTHREKVAHHSQGSTQVHWLNPETGIIDWNKLNPTPSKMASSANVVQGIETCQAEKHIKFRQQSSGADKMFQPGYKHALNDYQQSSSKTKDSLGKKKVAALIDEITYKLKVLNINSQGDEIVGQEIVPYEVKKRKPRPKVDLDPETERIWKLLMGKEGSENMEATDKEKEKKWEEERNVFRGRVDSFIARMHLVQGDRRFSKWKGSVVDSVIGVFLTQNVSDHLSSSAFISLAAKFSLRSKTNQWCYRHETSMLVEEPDIQTLEPDSIINGGGTTERHIFQQSMVTCSRSSEHSTESLTSGPRTVLAYEPNRREEEEIISSQNSDTSEEIRSSSGSNSEAEDGSKPNKNDSPVTHQNQAPSPTHPSIMHKETMLSLFYSQLNGSFLFNGQQQSENAKFSMQSQGFDRLNYQSSSAFTFPSNSNSFHTQESINQSRNLQLNMTPDVVLDVGYCGVLGEESISSLPSTSSRVAKARGVDLMNNGVGPTAEGIRKLLAKQNEVPKLEDPIVGPYKFLGKHPVPPKGDLQPGSNNQLSANSYKQARFNASQMGNTSITEKTTISEPAVTRKAGAKQQVADYQTFTRQCLDIEETTFIEKHSCFETKAAAANANEQNSQPLNGMVTATSKARKGKAETEKAKPFDWDSLRKQVQCNGEIKERSKETMDSMDYEAVRCADVKEISEAIKERGMNNILAERIKDFLNRLVDEHGSIDLEWLRDVPPDKAKDYLLSIQGLGLKSVECVRLLTLHHLAFPVDTNVGRIAVRLGWVPLQPLPESLQLHLLELYPVLESIQKYLWPRLCKLDQRTLYELHYQMITFGKVFCTKSKPNCNSCPMRGECRHFASAFASARLALPGPEDRSIVSSSASSTAEKHTAFITKPMQLPSAERNSIEEVRFSGSNCEPIVEEPTTPEPERSEITETDIEDAFYEDPDEIPTIKLNIEEFTINLHNYMQENMELQEGDMSKALVALNQEAASIPTPKLKNVRHLRTEHHVYELPDSHPLLEMLDKREPDDPSPYLLAIWTPGETADSIQPPKRTCGSGSQESCSTCDDHTCFSCNSIREANSQTVRGTLLIPCRTAMRGSFPLNGTYFQVNEVFSDHDSSLKPIDVPRAWLWNLPRRIVYFGTSVSTIFKGMPTEEIQYCFWRGFVCVRGFDQKTRAPRPLMARLHFPASKLTRTKK